MRRHRRTLALAVLVGALSLAGCSHGGPTFVRPGASHGSTTGFSLGVTPADNATDVPVSAEIGKADDNVKLAKVELTDADGKQVAGAMRPDGSSWVPDEPLDYSTKYTVKATGT